MVNSEPGTECHSLSMIHRCATLFAMGLHERCATDLRQAIGFKYPPEIEYELYQHAGNVYRKLGNREQTEHSYAECLRWMEEAHLTKDVERQFKESVALPWTSENISMFCRRMIGKRTTDDGNPNTEQLVSVRNKSIPAL